MAAVLETKDPATKFGSQVDEQIAEATSRIRFHDLALGGLLLVAMLLAYATGMILLDQYAVLPEWVRQVALLGFLATAAGVGYATIVRPLRRQVNPLYAAAQVEKTIEDAKNSVLGYVETKAKQNVDASVRAAMSVRAATSVSQADVNHAVDHRSLVYTGGVAIVFLLTLIILFFVFRPTQFGSLIGRTFAPFSADPIASRTQLTLVEPASGDATIPVGQSITIQVQVGGRVPNPEKPDRVRLLLRHNPAPAEFEELPMEKGETSRDWQVRVPDYLVRNGFWYKVAGGDSATPEFKVSVRTLPLFTDYEVGYEYPAYVRREPEKTRDSHLLGYVGTRVTIVGKTNRMVKDGRLVFEPPGRDPVIGKPVPDRPDCLQFGFTLINGGSYRLSFTSTEGERATDTAPFGITIIEDAPPVIEILKPEDDEIQLPANGQLAVDARVGDDFGIDKVTLRMKIVEPAELPLAALPYQDGKSFRRMTDDTWPKSLVYLDSVDFTGLKDPLGQKVELKEGMVIAYWLEATDNRTLPGPDGPKPAPNLGKSKVKRVRLTRPQVQPEEKAKLAEEKQQRKNEETKHTQAQQQRLENEKRDPKQQPDKSEENPPKNTEPPKDSGEPGKKPEDGMGDKAQPMPGNRGQPDPMNPPKDQPDPMNPPKGQPDPMNPPKGPDGMPPPPAKGMNESPPPKGADGMPMTGMPENGGMNNPDTAPPPRSEADKTAERVKEALDQQQRDGGSGKSNNDPAAKNQTPPAETKPPPMPGADQDPPKPEPKADPDRKDGMGSPGEPKSGGSAQPEPTASPKSEPNPMSGTNPPSSAPPNPKTPPQGGTPGADTSPPQPKTPPMPQSGDPKQPNPPKDPSGGGTGQSSTQPPPKPQPGGMGKNSDGSDAPKPMKTDGSPPPPNGTGQPMPKTDPGTDKGNPPEPKAGTPPPEGGQGTPQQSPQAGGPKSAPKDQNPMPGSDGANEPKSGPKPDMGDPSHPQPKGGGEPKAGSNTSPAGEANKPQSVPNAEDKPVPGQNPQTGGERPDQGQKSPEKGQNGSSGGNPQKLDPKQKEEIENAVRDLTSKDEGKRKAAEDKLDKTVGKENRKEAQDIANGLQSDKPEERAAAQDKLKDLQQKAGNAGQSAKKDSDKNPGGGQKMDQQDLANAARDLASTDPKKQQEARDKIDKAIGPEARKQAEKEATQLKEDLQSKDPERRKGAEQKLNDLKKLADQMGQNNPQPKKQPGENPAAGDQKMDQKDLANAARDLASSDPKKQQEARDKIDKAIGPEARKQAEKEAAQLKEDLQSKDPERRKGAEQKLNDLKKLADQMAQNNPQPRKQPGENTAGGQKEKVDPQAVEQAMDDLHNPDPKVRDAAAEKLDKMLGKGAGQKAKDANEKMSSQDLEKQAEGRKERDDLLKEAEAQAKAQPKGSGSTDPKQPKGKELTQQEKDALAKKLNDLNSPDEKTRKAAEKEFDQKLGEQNRKQLQEAMKKEPGTDQQKAEDIQKKMDEMAKNPGNGSADPTGNGNTQTPGTPDTKLNPPMPVDLRNLAKSRDLQLKDFEKNQHNKELLDRLGMTQEQYDQFLETYRKEIAQLKKEAAEAEKAEANRPAGPPPANISGGGKVDSQPNTTTGPGGVRGPGFAPPGYADAMRKFQQGATTLPQKK